MNFHLIAAVTILIYLLALIEYQKLLTKKSLNFKRARAVLFVGSLTHLSFLIILTKTNLIYSPFLISLLSFLLIVIFLILDLTRKNLTSLGVFVIIVTLFLLLIAALFFHLENSKLSQMPSFSIRNFHWIFLLVSYALLILNSMINLLWLVIEERIRRKNTESLGNYPSLFEISRISCLQLLLGYFTLIIGVVLSIDYSVNISLEKQVFFVRILFLLPSVFIYTYLMYIVFIKQDLGRKVAIISFWAVFSLAIPFLDSGLGQRVFHAY